MKVAFTIDRHNWFSRFYCDICGTATTWYGRVTRCLCTNCDIMGRGKNLMRYISMEMEEKNNMDSPAVRPSWRRD